MRSFGIGLFITTLLYAMMTIWAIFAHAHETNGWRHADRDFKGVVSMRYCPGSVVQNWRFEDGESLLAWYTHNTVHYKEGTCNDR